MTSNPQYVAPRHTRDATAWEIAAALREDPPVEDTSQERSVAHEDAKARAAWQVAQAREEAKAAYHRKQAEKRKIKCTIL